jgi:SAM-dependent MidA family methyltransferase
MTPNLPLPSAAELTRSEKLTASIQQQIKASGPISFANFMAQALYTPELGYYESANTFGAEGDFITAAHCGPWLANMLANQIAQIAPTMPTYIVAEFGAGDGSLALDLLQALHASNNLPKQYLIIEKSTYLQNVQQQALSKHPEFFNIIRWLDEIPEHFNGMIFANEVLDAMPFQRFKKTADNTFLQSFVDIQDNKLIESWLPATHSMPASIQQLPLEPEHIIETNPHLQNWLQQLFKSCQQSILLLIDYGTEQHSYFSRSKTGYARAFYKHRVHDDLLKWPGLQDLTTHINFTDVAQTAVNIGWEIEGYTTQANFLIDCGISDVELPSYDSETGILARAQIKKLCLPQDMGEMFKLLALSKNNTLDLVGFNHDMTERL